MEPRISVIRSPVELSQHIEAKLRGTDVFVVGICGVAGSGKTTLCNDVAEAACFNTVRLDCDQFSSHSSVERQALIDEATRSGIPERIESIENPKNWYSFDDIILALGDLKTTRTHTYDRAWNRETGDLDGRYKVALAADGPAVILCDCIYLLHPTVREEMDLAVLVETPEQTVTDRGLRRSKGDISRAAYMESLRRKYSVPYFEIFRSRADIVYQADL